MSKFNKVILTAALITLLLLAVSNLTLLGFWISDGGKYYLVEINRAYNQIQAEGFSNDVDDFDYIDSITLLPANSDDSEISDFYKDDRPYLIRTLGNDGIDGYIKFCYSSEINVDNKLAQVIVSTSLIMMMLFTFSVLFYIKKQIIKPFNEISELPFVLAKGHLTPALKESKNKYFGRFLWGLDLLRETLEEQKSRQLALNKEKKALILSISHDIKTPLSAIRLYTRALSENLYSDEKKKQDILDNIEKKTNEIEGFVSSIIKSSKEDFLNLEVNNTEFYLTELLLTLQTYYEDKLHYISCEFTVGHYENCLIYGDLDGAREVLENIIENAIKYGDGRRIAITAQFEEDAQLVTITNTGNSLPPNELLHMWESFWRGSNIGNQSGSGLGLYICRSIMTLMKGDIYAKRTDEGMSFIVVFKRL